MPSIRDLYVVPFAAGDVAVPQDFDATFNWRYDQGRAAMMGLYRKGVAMQWDTATRIDWSQELDPDNPQQLPEAMLPIAGMPDYEKMSRQEKAEVRRHFQGWQLSQFMHGEQAALICTSKIVMQVPDVDAKFYASTQVIDEARHVETYRRLLEKFGLAYPMTGPLWELVEQVLRDGRWDMTYLGMQIVIEGLALAAFQQVRDRAQNPLAAAVNAYVMQDEARHVAFGRLALRDYYPRLSQAERDEREQFLVEACFLMRDRFDAVEVWRCLGFDPGACAAHMYDSGFMQQFRSALFARIVPIVRDIGLWGHVARDGFERLDVMAYADTDVDAMQQADDTIARDFDRRRAYVDGVIARASAAE